MLLRHPSTIVVSGPTGCGKTQLVSKLLEHKAISPFPDRIVWDYGEWQGDKNESIKFTLSKWNSLKTGKIGFKIHLIQSRRIFWFSMVKWMWWPTKLHCRSCSRKDHIIRIWQSSFWRKICASKANQWEMLFSMRITNLISKIKLTNCKSELRHKEHTQTTHDSIWPQRMMHFACHMDIFCVNQDPDPNAIAIAIKHLSRELTLWNHLCCFGCSSWHHTRHWWGSRPEVV